MLPSNDVFTSDGAPFPEVEELRASNLTISIQYRQTFVTPTFISDQEARSEPHLRWRTERGTASGPRGTRRCCCWSSRQRFRRRQSCQSHPSFLYLRLLAEVHRAFFQPDRNRLGRGVGLYLGRRWPRQGRGNIRSRLSSLQLSVLIHFWYLLVPCFWFFLRTARRLKIPYLRFVFALFFYYSDERLKMAEYFRI